MLHGCSCHEALGCQDVLIPRLNLLPLNCRHNADTAVVGSLQGVRGDQLCFMHDGTKGGLVSREKG